MKRLNILFFPIFFLTTCRFSNFYTDPDDPGLSRFTSHGYNVISTYVNSEPFEIYRTSETVLSKDSGDVNSLDTLVFMLGTLSPSRKPLIRTMSFLIPVPRSFTKTSLKTLNGLRLTNIPFIAKDTLANDLSGTGNLYIVSVSEKIYPQNQQYVKFSGLFEGKIGDSINVSKGRFDFSINESSLNF